EPKVFVGEEKGTISSDIRGTDGFGYDPIFIPEGYDKTHAEDIEIKRKVSHRVSALEKLVGFFGK
ncbi:MAG: non-canonical purine NTP pyrophosphatase, partial [Candidatus Aenigmarchaeota archaeon]|nr:non-canonical purine NTP pyrophosphatase [Candidatus Aenigmarchaeota archaeon]